MEVPGITAYKLTHTCSLLENPALDLRVDMRLGHHYFLVDLVELLSKCGALIVASFGEGGKKELQVSAFWKIEVCGRKRFFAEALDNELLHAIVKNSTSGVCLHQMESVIEEAIVDDLCD